LPSIDWVSLKESLKATRPTGEKAANNFDAHEAPKRNAKVEQDVGSAVI